MSIKKDQPGRRYVQVQAEVPGTPEQVWDAIATGPGVSSWFVPTEMQPDGTVVSRFGPGMDSIARQTSYNPPKNFSAESDGFGPTCPPIATEWHVEAASGDTCIIRVVHSLFTDKDDWNNQLEGIESGWPDYFRLLTLYLRHFPGQYATLVQSLVITPKPPADFWPQLVAAFPLQGTPQGEPSPGHPNQLTLLLTDGYAHLFAMKMGPQTVVSLRLYRFNGAPANQGEWQQWLESKI